MTSGKIGYSGSSSKPRSLSFNTDSLEGHMSRTVALSSRSRAKAITAWTLQILLAATFLAAGGAKLAGVPMMVQTFDQLGVGQWFRGSSPD